MGDILKKVKGGEKLSIPAGAYNAFVDAANELRRSRADIGAGKQVNVRDPDIILVRNDSASACPAFSVLGIEEPLILPTGDLGQFQSRVALSCIEPTTAHTGKFVVLLEPIAAGKIGRAYVSGVCPVQITVASEASGADNDFADVTDSEVGYLTTAASGSAQVLWRDGGTGVQWAVVRLGNPSVGPTGPSGGSGGGALPDPMAAYYVMQVMDDPPLTWEQQYLLLSDGPGGAGTGNIWVTGPRGDTGPSGVSGSTGPSGVPGPSGPSGPAGGPPGETGPAGADGSSGPPGSPGADGASGPPGSPGADGSTGPPGSPGADGSTGPPGLPGLTGPAGSDGQTGPAGSPGADGSTGDAGPTGSAFPSNLEFLSAGSSGATEQAWVEVTVDGVTGYLHVFAAK